MPLASQVSAFEVWSRTGPRELHLQQSKIIYKLLKHAELWQEHKTTTQRVVNRKQTLNTKDPQSWIIFCHRHYCYKLEWQTAIKADHHCFPDKFTYVTWLSHLVSTDTQKYWSKASKSSSHPGKMKQGKGHTWSMF